MECSRSREKQRHLLRAHPLQVIRLQKNSPCASSSSSRSQGVLFLRSVLQLWFLANLTWSAPRVVKRVAMSSPSLACRVSRKRQQSHLLPIALTLSVSLPHSTVPLRPITDSTVGCLRLPDDSMFVSSASHVPMMGMGGAGGGMRGRSVEWGGHEGVAAQRLLERSSVELIAAF